MTIPRDRTNADTRELARTALCTAGNEHYSRSALLGLGYRRITNAEVLRCVARDEGLMRTN